MSPAAAYMVPVVLLVDHELSVRRAAAEEMEVAGLHVLEAANADDALRLLREQSDDVQVLVTDVDMRSATSGISLAVEVHRSWPHILLLMTSGAPRPRSEDIREHDEFIQRPYVVASVISRIWEMIRSRSRS